MVLSRRLALPSLCGWWTLIYGLIPAALSVIVFAWILDLGFWLDDFIHLYDLSNYGYLRLIATPHGGHLLSTTHSVYFALHYLFGATPWWWFLVVILTHALNAVLLFRAVHAWTSRPLLASLLSTLWAISPVNEAALSWIAVYGHVLAATFVLWLLGDIATVKQGDGAVPFRVQIRWLCLLLAAATSFGVGLGISLWFFAAAWLLLPPVQNRRQVVRTFAASALCIVALYLVQRWFFLSHWTSHSIPYDPVPYLLTEWAGDPLGCLRRVAVELVGLVGYGLATLFMGPAALSASRGVFFAGPWQGGDLLWVARGMAMVAVVIAVISLTGAAAARRRIAAGLAVLVVACYAPVAVILAVRSLVSLHHFGIALPDSLVLEPRYQYVGPALLTLIVGIVCDAAADRWRMLSTAVPVLLIAWLLSAGPAYWQSRGALGHPLFNGAVPATMSSIRTIVLDYPVGSDAYVENRALSYPYMGHDVNFPGLAAFFTIFNADDTLEGRRVHFVEHDPELLRILKADGGRIARLLVSRDQVMAPPRSAQ